MCEARSQAATCDLDALQDTMAPQEHGPDMCVGSEREKAVAAAVAVVVASSRKGVVSLCASVAHIIRNNIRLQQQVRELEGRLRPLDKLSQAPESCAGSLCPSSQGFTSDSLPESPTAQRCGSAPPNFANRASRMVARKASESEAGAPFLRGQTRASTGNLSRCGRVSSFMRRKYSTISLRRIRRTSAARQGRAALSTSQRSSITSLEHQHSTSRGSTKSCIVTVAEVYSPPTPPPSATTSFTESDTIKLLAHKLTCVLQEEDMHTQEDTEEDMMAPVVCSPHPLSGCECAVCVQLMADPDVCPYEITTDEGSLLPPGTTVLVRGRRVGTVNYFGHCRHPLRGTSHSQLPVSSASATTSTRGLVSAPSSLTSPLGVTVLLWPPDEGEVFVPLNDVICPLDEELSSHSPEEPVDFALENETIDRSTENSPRERGRLHLDPSLPNLLEREGVKRKVEHMEESCIDEENYGVPEIGNEESGEDHEGLAITSQYMHTSPGFVCTHDIAHTSHEHKQNTPVNSESVVPNIVITGNINNNTSERVIAGGTETSLHNLSMPNHPQETRCSECENDLETRSSVGKEKLQLGDTWDSGCYMSIGRYSSECSEQFSDMESEHSSTDQQWASSLEEALDSVWKKHRKHQDGIRYFRKSIAQKLIPDREIELRDYGKLNSKVSDESFV